MQSAQSVSAYADNNKAGEGMFRISSSVRQDNGMAQIDAYYCTADEFYLEFMPSASVVAPRRASSRDPNDDNVIGGLLPVGGALLPMIACILLYAVYKLWRVNNFKKAIQGMRNRRKSMARRWMAVLVLVVGGGLLPLSAQAESLYDMDGDTITISYQRSGTYYMMTALDEETAGYVAAANADMTALWEVHVETNAGTDGFRLRNISTDTWLLISYTAMGNWIAGAEFSLIEDGEMSATALYVASCTGYAAGGVLTTATYLSDNRGTSYYLYMSNGPSWNISTSSTYTMRIEKWTAQKDVTLSIAPSSLPNYSNSVQFGFVDEANKFAADQKQNIVYKAEQTIETYIKNVPELNDVKIGYEKQTSLSDELSVSFAWQSSMSLTSVLTADLVDNYGEAEEESAPRNMLLCDVAKDTGVGLWNVAITPQGKSPINLKDAVDRKYINYVDVLKATVSDKAGHSATHLLNVTRDAGHYVKMDGLQAVISPSDYIFDAAEGTAQFEVQVVLQEGEQILGVDEKPLSNGDWTYDYSVSTPLGLDQLKLTLSMVPTTDETGDIDWATASEVAGQDALLIEVEENNSTAVRRAAMAVRYEYTDPNAAVHSTSTRTRITQLSTSMTGAVKLVHRPGVGNTALDPVTGYQPVHTVEKTIYYAPDSEVRLRLNEVNFDGYWRWYDYETDKDPRFDRDGNQTVGFWKEPPTARDGNYTSTYLFKSINDDPATSHGLYADATRLALGSRGCPLIKAWTDEQVRDIACDVSAYIDYDITDTAIYEPTLSYRQIFHLRPASEMAEALAKCTGEYYETHHCLAPTQTEILLSTNFAHYNPTDESDLCYFCYNNQTDKKLLRVGYNQDVTAVWYKDGQKQTSPKYSGDYLSVSSDKEGKVLYELRIPASSAGPEQELLLASFEVDFVSRDKYGPSGNTLITDETINSDYILLSKKDFNYNVPGTTDIVYYSAPLAWDETTYGYVYPDENNPVYKRPVQETFPYYGEYSIVNKTDKGWAVGEQHGGAANGYCLYVDGTKEPGLVASINTEVQICSGQQLYCYAWICNPTPATWNGGSVLLPRFRFSVQGRSEGGEWEDIGQFSTGEIPLESGWQQVMFPLMSANNYDESRVSIYNFAMGNNDGNDFYVDDICLFASKLPLQAYQATTTCVDDSVEVPLVRIDYTQLTADWVGKRIYYQIYNTTNNTALKTNYYRDDTAGDELCEYGYATIPAADYDPSADNAGSGLVYASLGAFVESLQTEEGRLGGQVGYVKIREQDKERWVLYMGELIDKTQLASGNTYEVRIASDVAELDSPDCARRTDLSIRQKSAVLFDGELPPSAPVCPNRLYPATVLVSNQYIDDEGNVQTLSAQSLTDWLIAFDTDDCYHADDAETLTKQKEALADAAFAAKYGWERTQVWEAIGDMRQVPTKTEPNPNYTVSDVAQLQTTDWFGEEDLAVISDLVEKGFLILGQYTQWCNAAAGETVRYWVFPISGTAITEDPVNSDRERVLDDCNIPALLRVYVDNSEYTLTLAPLTRAEMTEEQRAQTPGVRVPANRVNQMFYADISECSSNIELVEDSCRLVETNDPAMAAKLAEPGFRLCFSNDLDIASGRLTLEPLSDNTDAMRAGYEYTLRVKMRDVNLGTSGGQDCEVGYAYLKVKVIPDTMVWVPTVSNEWGDDRNWRAVVGGDTLTYGYVPLYEHTCVVIPTLQNEAWYPAVSTENRYPIDSRYTPNGCKYVRFCKGATMLNQHLLQYQKAFVDVAVPSAKWYSFAAPLQQMYSGDLFIPHSGKYTDANPQNLESENDFEVAPFQGTRLSDAAYIFSAAYYNRSVTLYHTVSATSTAISSDIADFVRSNALDEKFAPGQGVQIRGYGTGDDGEELLIRLPKPDQAYYYYDKVTGAPVGSPVTLERAFGNKFAFELDGDQAMTIRLSNETSSQDFLFGNPTMAYIDMDKFCSDNTNIENNFRYMDGSSWVAVAPANTSSREERLVAPMQSVLLTAKTASEAIDVQLKAAHLTNRTELAGASAAPAGKAQRRKVGANTVPAVMDIGIYTPVEKGAAEAEAVATAAVVSNTTADNAYVQGEDVLFVSSGVETDNNVVVTPLNLYTVADNQTLMVDVRNSLGIIPLGIVVDDNIRNEYDSLVLAFKLTKAWTAQCYLCDDIEHTRIPIRNDLLLKIPTPDTNHQVRYYIEGPDYNASEGPGTATGNPAQPETTQGAANGLYVISTAEQSATIVSSAPMAHVRVYDVVGHTVCDIRLDAPAPMLHLTLPSGVAVVEATLATGETLYQKAYVR